MFRKDNSDGDLTISFGSLFQMSGADDWKAHVPMIVLVTDTACRREFSVYRSIVEERCCGCPVLMSLHVVTAICSPLDWKPVYIFQRLSDLFARVSMYPSGLIHFEYAEAFIYIYIYIYIYICMYTNTHSYVHINWHRHT